MIENGTALGGDAVTFGTGHLVVSVTLTSKSLIERNENYTVEIEDSADTYSR